MEFVVEPRTFGHTHLLGVPGPGLSLLDPDDDDEECNMVIGIRPRSSPLPRRKSSISEEDAEEAEAPPPGSRRVSFADAKGLSLVLVKEFDTWDVPKLPGFDPLQGAGQEPEQYYLSFPTHLIASPLELGSRVREQKVELESVTLLPGTTTLRGVVRVLNISFDKTVYVRTTLDAWASHFDLLAEYIQGSSDGVTDCFSFKLTLVPPFDEQGARVDFCLRYETPLGTFWANNCAKNYVLFCHQRVQDVTAETLQRECVCKKSCLKAASLNFKSVENSSSEENMEKSITAVSKQRGADNMKSKQVSDSPSGSSAEDLQKLTTENSQNCSRRSLRRAARLAKVKDIFAQRDNTDENKGSEVSMSVTSGRVEGKNSEEMILDFPACSDEPPVDVLRDPSPARSGDSLKAENHKSVDLVGPVDPVQDRSKPDTAGDNRPRDYRKPRASVAVDTSRNRVEVDCQESEREFTGTTTNPQPTTEKEMTPAHINNDTLKECVTRENLNLQGKPIESLSLHQRKNRSEKQTMADTAEAQTEHIYSDIKMQVNTQTQAQEETTHPELPFKQPRVSANEEIDLQVDLQSGRVAIGFIHAGDESNKQDGVQSTITVSTISAHSEHDKETEPPKAMDANCVVYSATEANNSTVEDQSIPVSSLKTSEDELGSVAMDLSQAMFNTSLETVEGPNNVKGRNELTDHLEEDIMPIVGNEEIVEITESIGQQSSSCTNPDTLAKRNEHDLVKKTACMPVKKENSDIEDIVIKQVCDRADVRTKEKDWEVMVEEEEDDVFGEEKITTKEITETEEKENKELMEVTGGVFEIVKRLGNETTEGIVISEEDRVRNQDKQMEEQTFTEQQSAAMRQFNLGREEMTTEEETEGRHQEVKKEVTEDAQRHKQGDDVQGLQEEAEEAENVAKRVGESQENLEEEGKRTSDYEDERSVTAIGEADIGVEVVEENAGGTTEEERKDETESSELRSGGRRNKAENGSTTPASNVLEGERQRVIYEGSSWGNEATCTPNEMSSFSSEGEEQNKTQLTNDQSKSISCSGTRANDLSVTEKGSLVLPDEPEGDPVGEEEGNSTDSLSDEEMELYMHRLRAVPRHTPRKAVPGVGKGLSMSKRPSIDRHKQLPLSMPSISESVNEDYVIRTPDSPEEKAAATLQPKPTAVPEDNREYVGKNAAHWKNTFFCSNISNSLLYITLLVVFITVAYHYDFLACFALYLISIFWLYCRAEKKPVPNNNSLD